MSGFSHDIWRNIYKYTYTWGITYICFILFFKTKNFE